MPTIRVSWQWSYLMENKLKVKNISARFHHIGNVSIAPGEEKEIPKAFENSIGSPDLVVIAEPKKEAPANDEPKEDAPKSKVKFSKSK